MHQIIYLDNNSTTRVDDRVISVMLPYLNEIYGNPSSNHSFGQLSNNAVKIARKNVASLLNADENEIIFTSSATESINFALKGIYETSNVANKHIITVKTEHKATLEVCQFLETKGVEITYLGVDSSGLINLEDLINSIKNETILVAIMIANNETGVIQNVREISKICFKNNVTLFMDATQAAGKIVIDLKNWQIDLLALSGHKMHAPKGIGALYVNKKSWRKFKLTPLIHGGGQERNLRGGTLSLANIVALGEAAKIAKEEMNDIRHKVAQLRDYLETELLKFNGIKVNGSMNRLFNVSNVMIDGIDSDALMIGLENIMISNGSACTSKEVLPSHVLTAMGLSEEKCFSSVRISLSKYNTVNEIEFTLNKLRETIYSLRRI